MKQEERMRSELEDQLGMQEQQKEQCKATNIHRGLHERRRRETKYATRKEGAFMEKVTRRELLSQGNPKSSSQTSFSVQNVSSMQRMLVHMDTQQDEFTKVLDNFQRVQVDNETGLFKVTSKEEPDLMMFGVVDPTPEEVKVDFELEDEIGGLIDEGNTLD